MLALRAGPLAAAGSSVEGKRGAAGGAAPPGGRAALSAAAALAAGGAALRLLRGRRPARGGFASEASEGARARGHERFDAGSSEEEVVPIPLLVLERPVVFESGAEGLPSYIRAGDLGRYVVAYAERFGVRQLVRFGARVCRASSPQLAEDSQVIELPKQNNKVLEQMSKLLEKQNEAIEVQNNTLEHIAEKAGGSAPRHKNIKNAVLAGALKTGSLEGVQYEGIFHGKDKRRGELLCAIFYKTHIEGGAEMFDGFDDQDANIEKLFRMLPSFRAELLGEAKTHDALLGDKAEMMPEGAVTKVVKQVLGEIPQDLQALHEVMLPANKQFKPVLPRASAEKGKEQFESVAILPKKAKDYFDEFKLFCLEGDASERICTANAIAAWRWQVSKVAEKAFELDVHKYTAAKRLKRDEDTEEKKKLEHQKMFFDVYIRTSFPNYTKINNEYEEMKAEKTGKQEFGKIEVEDMAARPPSDWRGISPGESLAPFENTQDMFEAMRQELGLTGPPENTQCLEEQEALEENAQLPNNEAESPRSREPETPEKPEGETDELDDEDAKRQELEEPETPEKLEVREKELQAVSSSGEKKRGRDRDELETPAESEDEVGSPRSREPETPEKPESETDELDDEDTERQKLVPEEGERLVEEPEVYVVFSSPDTGTTEPASDAEVETELDPAQENKWRASLARGKTAERLQPGEPTQFQDDELQRCKISDMNLENGTWLRDVRYERSDGEAEAMQQQTEQLPRQNEELNRRPLETERLTQQAPRKRLVKQPGAFDGARAEWSDWSFTFRAYAAAASVAITRLTTTAEAKGPEPMEIPDEDFDAEQAQANGQPYYVLVMLAKGAALKKAKSAPVGHGSEAWRLLVYEYEPKPRRRFQAMLSSVLRAKLPDPLSESLDNFESGIENQTVGLYLDLNDSTLVDAMVSNGGKGRGKGKEPRGKGKDPKGRGKAADKSDKKCFYCGSIGRVARNCRKRIADERAAGKAASLQPQQMAARCAQLAFQQAAAAAAPQRAQQQQSATLIAANVDAWPDTDDEHGIHMLLEATSNDGKDTPDGDPPVAMINDNQPDPVTHVYLALAEISDENDAVWVMFDIGSGATACPSNFARDIEVDASRGRGPWCEAATGTSVDLRGRHCVPMLIEGQPFGFDFHVGNVHRPIVIAQAFLDAGYGVHLEQDYSYMLGPKGQVIPIHRRHRAFSSRVKRSGMTSGMEVISAVQPALEGRARAEMDANDLVEDTKRSQAISEEAQRARARGIPTMPPVAERLTHRLIHMPCRNWCGDCAAGRGREAPHPRRTVREALLPRAWMDYCFPSTRRDVTNQVVILVVLEEDSGAIESLPVPGKGPADFHVKTVARAIESWGRKRAVCATHGEPVIKAPITAIKLERKDETACSSAPRYDSQPKGRPCRGAIAEMCETVFFHKMHRHKGGFRAQCEKGIWLGKEAVRRSTCLTKSVLDRFGRTAGCKACEGRCRSTAADDKREVRATAPRATRSPRSFAPSEASGVNPAQCVFAAMVIEVADVNVEASAHAARSGILLGPALVEAGRQRERGPTHEFGAHEHALRSEARGKRVGAQCLRDERHDDDGAMFARARLVAMQVAREAGSDCFAGARSLPCAGLVLSFVATLVGGALRRLVALHDVSVALYHALLDEDIWAAVGGTDHGLCIKHEISWADDGFHRLADTAHLEKGIAHGDRAERGAPSRLFSPGSKRAGKSRKGAADVLGDQGRSEYRSLAPLAHFAAVDRTAVLQGLQLERLGSHLKTRKELQWDFVCQETLRELRVEAELRELVNGAARGLSFKQVLEEMGVLNLVAKVGGDSAAALGISHSLGASRRRHLGAKQLWIQKKTRSGEVQPIKIKTAVNRGDLLTKFHDPEGHWALVSALPLSVPSARRGASALAVAAALMHLPETAEALGKKETESMGINPMLVALWLVVLNWLISRLRGKKSARKMDQSAQTDEVVHDTTVPDSSSIRSAASTARRSERVFAALMFGEKSRSTRVCGGLSTAREVKDFERCKAPWLAAVPSAGSRAVEHSRSYRGPSGYASRVLLVVGGRSSAVDIAREDGRLVLSGGETVPGPPVERVILATGYEYEYPFLDGAELGLDFGPVARYVAPLFMHVLHARRPSLGFIGVPLSVPVPIPLFEAQARFVAAHLRNQSTSTEQRGAWVAARRAAVGERPMDMHFLAGDCGRKHVHIHALASPAPGARPNSEESELRKWWLAFGRGCPFVAIVGRGSENWCVWAPGGVRLNSPC
ncbi:unnamed protein product [Prorocentrum cordatum]|uniref:CCHC-type domain-containing protein n=1 Tax=Prorocentrum cordatum TaxID=2364126 RepID=A0ABN9UVJ9_9DINO|nr:unnamed protein product [Polarella glacialis]